MIVIKPEPAYSLGFSVTGHAGFAPNGQDIVCASVSTASYLTAQAVNSHMINSYDGYLKVQYNENKNHKHIVNAFLTTMRELESQYPAHIQVIPEKEDTE